MPEVPFPPPTPHPPDIQFVAQGAWSRDFVKTLEVGKYSDAKCPLPRTSLIPRRDSKQGFLPLPLLTSHEPPISLPLNIIVVITRSHSPGAGSPGVMLMGDLFWSFYVGT